ncbi:hypothetical protein C0995_003570, partial [Termitomyces sp. Mi166
MSREAANGKKASTENAAPGNQVELIQAKKKGKKKSTLSLIFSSPPRARSLLGKGKTRAPANDAPTSSLEATVSQLVERVMCLEGEIARRKVENAELLERMTRVEGETTKLKRETAELRGKVNHLDKVVKHIHCLYVLDQARKKLLEDTNIKRKNFQMSEALLAA